MSAARAFAETYLVQLRTTLAVQFQYRAALLIWLIGAVLEPLIYLIVWTTVAQAQGGSVEGMTAGDFAAYYIVAMVVNQLTFTWVMWEWEYFIREGALSAWLLRPWHPVHHDLSENIAYKLLTLAIMAPTAALLILVFRPTFQLQLWSLLAFVPALGLAFALRFAMEWTLALVAFWTTRLAAVNYLYYVTFLFFSGRLAPLTLFPAAIGALAWFLPFRWTLSFPISLFLGQLTPREALIGFGAQIGWTLAALLLARVVWRAGVRRYGAVGG